MVNLLQKLLPNLTTTKVTQPSVIKYELQGELTLQLISDCCAVLGISPKQPKFVTLGRSKTFPDHLLFVRLHYHEIVAIQFLFSKDETADPNYFDDSRTAYVWQNHLDIPFEISLQPHDVQILKTSLYLN